MERGSKHAALLHLSTCYVAGQRDGRVSERVRPNYTPTHLRDFDAQKEWYRLHELVESAEARAEGPEIAEELRKQSLEKEHAAKGLSGQALEIQVRKNRVRWLKNYLTEEATRRAKELGYRTLVLASEIEGETREIARMHAAIAREIVRSGRPVKPPACIIGSRRHAPTAPGTTVMQLSTSKARRSRF